MNKFKSLIFLTLLMAGCTKNFESINTNPNAPDKVANPGLLFPNIIRSSVNSHFYNSYARGDIAGNLLASDFASNFSNWSRSDADGYFLWNYYDYIRDLNEIIKTSEENNFNNYKGIALVLRSWMFQCLTDIYGPIPFRESANAKLQNINAPKYETQEAVYAGLLADLEEANSLLGTSSEIVIGDILFNSKLSNWKKFANGLSLRLLMRQSNRVDPTAAMKNIVEHPDKYPLFQSYEEQAALQYSADRQGNENPFYRSGVGATSTKLTKQLVDYLKSMNDTRLYVYALPTPASSAKDANGNQPTPDKFEYAGALNGNGSFVNPDNFSPFGMLWMSIQYNPDLTSPTAAQGIILSYSEVQFILAEAAEKGYISGGSLAAEIYYKNGIESQFKYYASRIPESYANSYLQLKPSDIAAGPAYFTQPAVAYAGSSQDKLEKIWLQKWISLYLVGYEAWSEYRRTGFPNIPVGPIGPGYIPGRSLYPADELRINESNYQEAVKWLGADDLKTHVWWAK